MLILPTVGLSPQLLLLFCWRVVRGENLLLLTSISAFANVRPNNLIRHPLKKFRSRHEVNYLGIRNCASFGPVH